MNLYEILDLPVNCTQEDIKKSYKKKAILLHPDKGGSNETFQQLNQAYEILSNPEKRQEYDNGKAVPNYQDIFSNIFGNFSGFNQFTKVKEKCHPIVIALDVSLSDLYKGTTKKVKYTKKMLCDDCKGYGFYKFEICDICKGNGKKIELVKINEYMMQQQILNCPKCTSGFLCENEDRCKKCDGKQIIDVEKSIDVSILPGMSNKQTITYEKIGNNTSNKIIEGDVIIVLNQIEHPYLIRKNDDLIYKLHISLKDSLLGFSSKVILLDDIEYNIESELKCTESHSKWKFENIGMPVLNSVSRGSLIIKIYIDFPISFSQEDRDTILSLKYNDTSTEPQRLNVCN